MAAVTLQGTIEKTYQMRGMVAERAPVEDTRRLAHEIYRDAVEMVAAELQFRPLISDERTVHPIMADLHEALKDPAYQTYTGDIIESCG